MGRCARTAIKCLSISKFTSPLAKLALGGRLSGLRTVVFSWAYILLVVIAPFAQMTEAYAPVIAEADLERYRKIVQLERFLAKYNSPLTPYSETFVNVADLYGLDWRLLPAIAGTESTFGKVHAEGTYNPFGWGNGYIRFASWEEGIERVGRGLFENYYLNGARPLDIDGIGRIYAESPYWPRSVRFWMNKIETVQLSAVLD